MHSRAILVEIHYLNMVKYRKQGDRKLSDPLHRWLTWFDRDSPQVLVMEVVKMDTAIKTANERMAQVTKDKEAMRAYWRHQMALSDRTVELNYARDEGLKQGREEAQVIIAKKENEIAWKDNVIVSKDAEIARLRAQLPST